eukprot:scaffold154_cov19-Tisochrysis_lutea.AAC.3
MPSMSSSWPPATLPFIAVLEVMERHNKNNHSGCSQHTLYPSVPSHPPDLRSKSTGESSNTSSSQHRHLHQATPTSSASLLHSPSTSILSGHTCVVSTGSAAAVSNSLDWVTSGAVKPLPPLPTSAASPDHQQQHQQRQQSQQQRQGGWQAASPSTPGCSHGASTCGSSGSAANAAATSQKAGAAARAAGLFADAQGSEPHRGRKAGAASMEDSALEGGACKGGVLYEVEVEQQRQACGGKQASEPLQRDTGNVTPVSGGNPVTASAAAAAQGSSHICGGDLAAHTQASDDPGKQGERLQAPATAVSRAGVPAGLMEARQLAHGQSPSQMDALTPEQQQGGHSSSAQGGVHSWASSSTPPYKPLELTWESSPSPSPQQPPPPPQQQQQQQQGSLLLSAPSLADPGTCCERFQFQHTNPLAHEPPSPDCFGREATAGGAAVGGGDAAPGEARSHEVGGGLSAPHALPATPHLGVHSSQSRKDKPGVSNGSLTTFSWNVLFGDDGLASGQATPAAATTTRVAGHAMSCGSRLAAGNQQQGMMPAAAAPSPVLALCAPAAAEPASEPVA